MSQFLLESQKQERTVVMVVVSVAHCGVCACHAHAQIDPKSCEENNPLDRASFAPKKKPQGCFL